MMSTLNPIRQRTEMSKAFSPRYDTLSPKHSHSFDLNPSSNEAFRLPPAGRFLKTEKCLWQSKQSSVDEKSPGQFKSPTTRDSDTELTSASSSSFEDTSWKRTLLKKKMKKRRKSSKISELPSNREDVAATGSRENRIFRTKPPDFGCPQVSCESVNEYLANVSKNLQDDRLLGKLVFPRANRTKGRRRNEKSDLLSMNLRLEAGELKRNGMVGISGAHRRKAKESASSMSRSSSMNENGATIWSTVINIFKFGCWRGHGSSSTSVDQEIELEEGSVSDSESSSVDTSSKSSSTPTVTATMDAVGRSREAEEGVETEISRTVSSDRNSDKRFVAAKLVDSLKRFFSIFNATSDVYCSQRLENEVKPYSQKGSTNRKVEDPSEQMISDSSSGASVNVQLLLAERPLPPRPSQSFGTAELSQFSTSDCEVVDISSKHRQPM